MPVSDSTARIAARVAQRVSGADALLVTAGAGMSADSGLPVFRGNEGFWRAYPPLRDLGTAPHAGYDILRRWAAIAVSWLKYHALHEWRPSA